MVLGLRLVILLSKLVAQRKRVCSAAVASQGGGLEGLIDPGEQVAIDEQLLARQSGEIGEKRKIDLAMMFGADLTRLRQ